MIVGYRALISVSVRVSDNSHSSPTEERYYDKQVVGRSQAIGREMVGNSFRKISRATMRGSRRDASTRRLRHCKRSSPLITSIMTDITPRVNGARMSDYMGRTVRLICKVTKVRVFLVPQSTPLTVADQIVGNTAMVEASDGANIEVALALARNL